jgi:hypothetical protein
MRTIRIALLVTLVGACHHATSVSTTPIPQTVLAPGAPGPVSIPCDTPVVVKATTDHDGVEEERAWLRDHYPGHSPYNQSLGMRKGHPVDILEFQTADGRSVSVCFDITASFGHF